MRFLWRNAIFILFPAVVTAIIFLAMINVGTAVQFGQWGEKSIAESATIVINTKIERLEHMILSADTLFFGTIDPDKPEQSCDKWHKATYLSRFVLAGFVLDDFGDIVTTYYRLPYNRETRSMIDMFRKEIAPQIDKYDSFNQYKHLHLYINGEYYLVTHLTTEFEGQDYISCLLYDTNALQEELLPALLENVGEDRLANVVDDHNQPVFGQNISGSEEFIVSKRFPSTLYKWRLQLAPTASALFSAKEKERARVFSEALLIPLALIVIVLGLVVLYLSMVRERRLNRLKSEFVANVTHELKTPLSLIRMFGELLSLGKADPTKAKHYYEIILRETERLTALIDNVLNLARIERGKTGYNFAECDIAEAVERGVEITKPRLEKQNLKLVLNMSGDRLPVRIDDGAVTLAVVNLIDNAVKYATDTKFIGVDLIQTSKAVTIDVYDQGPGIPKNQMKRIFDRFYRVSSAETKRQRGSGIGLSLVRDIAVGHGGTIQVTSTPYVETRFSIRIPVEHFGR